MRAREPLLLLLLVSGCSCEGRDLPLDVVLQPGEVRAGRISSPGALNLGPNTKAQLGDFKLYNDRIAVTIADVGRATGFSPFGGGLLDADLANSERSAFGEVIVALDLSVLETETVELINDGADGEPARVRVTGGLGVLPLFDAILGDLLSRNDAELQWTIDYVLAPNTNVLRIEHAIKNLGALDVEFGVLGGFFFGTGARPFLAEFGFSASNSGAGSDYYAAANDRISYLYGQPDGEVAVLFGESGLIISTVGSALKLRARELKTLSHVLVVGDGDIAKTQAAWRTQNGDPEGVELSGQLLSAEGSAIGQGRVHVTLTEPRVEDRDYVTRMVTDAEGRFSARLSPGRYTLTAALDDGRVSEPVEIELMDSPMDTSLTMPVSGTLSYSISDDANEPLPSKLTIIPQMGAHRLLPNRYGELERGDAGARFVFAHTGEGQLALPTGAYEVLVSRGGEYEIHSQMIEVSAGQTARVEATLRRSVDTIGWMSTDPHVHAQLSPDSPDEYPRKVRAMVAENIELPVSTEHEAVGDFNPAIRALGLEKYIQGIVGTEISTTRYGHFNAFPLIRDPGAPGGGRIDWYRRPPAETFSQVRAREEAPFLQVNHPRSTTIGYFELSGFDRTTLTAARDFSLDFDGLEVLNGCGDGSMMRPEVLDWFALLDRGHRVAATGTLDDHHAGRGELGFPITYVKTNVEDPGAVDPNDVRQAYKSGRLIVSCGPFITAKIGEAGIGDLVEVDQRIEVEVEVWAPSWMDVDRVHLLINGAIAASAEIPESAAPMRFSGTLMGTTTAGQDGWAILWASGDRPHGAHAKGRTSYAFTNPIYLDGNRDGEWSR